MSAAILGDYRPPETDKNGERVNPIDWAASYDAGLAFCRRTRTPLPISIGNSLNQLTNLVATLYGSAKTSGPQSWNRYGYVSGDPVNGNDPSGLSQELFYAPPQVDTGGEFDGDFVSGTDGVSLDPALMTLSTVFVQIGGVTSGGGGPAPTPQQPVQPDCNALTAAVGFAGLNYGEASEVWNDLASTKGINNVADAALGVVTWAGESGFARNPVNNGNTNGSVDIGPVQMNYQIWKSSIPTSQQNAVFGTNLSPGQTFNGDTDANLTAGLKYLSYLYGKFGDQAAGLYTGRNNPNRPKRQATFDAYSHQLEALFSNKDCFPDK